MLTVGCFTRIVLGMKKKAKLKLYVWTGFSPDYTDGLAFAIAADEANAKKQVIASMGYDPYVWGNLDVRPLSRRFASAVSGGS